MHNALTGKACTANVICAGVVSAHTNYLEPRGGYLSRGQAHKTWSRQDSQRASTGDLPLLSTHLSLPEIAGELFLSRNTIKTEANSIYRKLGAASRSQAVTRSRELGLLEG